MNLTDREKQIKVAKACGWIIMRDGRAFNATSMLDDDNCVTTLPDYANSLDAMAEAEKTLTPPQFETYRWILWDLCKRPQVTERNRAYLAALAAQRFEAFGKTLNLW